MNTFHLGNFLRTPSVYFHLAYIRKLAQRQWGDVPTILSTEKLSMRREMARAVVRTGMDGWGEVRNDSAPY